MLRGILLLVGLASLNACTMNQSKSHCEVALNKKQLAHLSSVAAAQDEVHRSRYAYRHPEETLEFFGIQPGMTVLEVLPGGGWYSKILLPYLGEKGTLIGADYEPSMWPNFSFATPEFVEQRKVAPQKWQDDAKSWGGSKSAVAFGSTLSSLPTSFYGKVDAALYIRAMHNLVRFENKGQYFSKALAETFKMLRPGGVVGVVQHAMSEDAADVTADGSRGYLKRSFVINEMEKVGFEFVGESMINLNSKDQPSETDIVWRLAPTFYGSKEGSEERESVAKIGESNRVTLKFKKPI